MNDNIKQELTKYENIASNNVTIQDSWKAVMVYLYDAEGYDIHYNSTEDDITSPGGIYKKEHPDADIFHYIDLIATSIGIETVTTNWDKDTIDQVNNACNKDIIHYLVYQFYYKYLDGAHLDMFIGSNAIMMVSLYTNSEVGSWESVQSAIWDMFNMKVLHVNKSSISSIDGNYGSKTSYILNIIKQMDAVHNILFKSLVLSRMKSYYSKLIHNNPDKYLRYISGWDNRMNNLMKL